MYMLNYISIIVSSEEGVDFYKSLGFEEISRDIRPEQHDEVIKLSDGITTLKIYKDPTHPKRITNPEAYGLRSLCFRVEKIEGECKEDKFGRFKYIYDPDGLPIEIREVKPTSPKEWSFSE